MNWYENIKNFYPIYYTEDDIKLFVEAGMISTKEYEVIIGEKYVK